MGITQILEGSKWWTRTALVIACGTLIAGASEGIAPDNVSVDVSKEAGWCWANGLPWVHGGYCKKEGIGMDDCWKNATKFFQPLAAMEYSKNYSTCTLHTWNKGTPSTCPKGFTPRKSNKFEKLKGGVVQAYKGSGHRTENMECWRILVKEPGYCRESPVEGGSPVVGGYCAPSDDNDRHIKNETDCLKIGIEEFPQLAAMTFEPWSSWCKFNAWNARASSKCPRGFFYSPPPYPDDKAYVQGYRGDGDAQAKCWRFESAPSTKQKCKAIPKKAYQQMQQKPSKCPT